MKKFKFGFLSWVVSTLVIVLVIGATAYSYSGNANVVVEGDYIEAAKSQAEAILGGGSSYANSFLYAARGLFTESNKGVSIGTFVDGGLDSNGAYSAAHIVDGYTVKMVNVDLSATSSAGVVNPEGETIWVYDATLYVETATTSAISYRMGTTTAGIVGANDTCGATDSCSAGKGGMASILYTGTAAASTVGDTYFKLDYQGTDTRDGSGVRYVVPVRSGEYLTCFASTTPADKFQVGGQGAQCQFKYFVLE